jgi:adenylate cyclase
MFCV